MEVTSKTMNLILNDMELITSNQEHSVGVIFMHGLQIQRLGFRLDELRERVEEQDETIEELEGRIRDLEAGSYGDPPEDPEALIEGENPHNYGPMGWEDA